MNENDELFLSFSFETLEPLLWDISINERLAQRYNVAKTILHELCHVIGFILDGRREEAEPFFENDVVAELGEAMEQNVLGGRLESLGRPSMPNHMEALDALSLGGAATSWPAPGAYERLVNSKQKNVIYDPPQSLRPPELTFYPFPAKFFEEVQQQAFWDNIQTFGTDALHMGPLTMGRRFAPDCSPWLNFITWKGPYSLKSYRNEVRCINSWNSFMISNIFLI